MAYDQRSGVNKKKISIIALSSILLMAVVGAVTYGVTRKHGHSGSDDNSNAQVTTSSKAVNAICQPTDYKEACETSLESAKNTSDPKELMKTAFQAAVTKIDEAINNSSLLKEAAKDARISHALETCKGLLKTSIDDLQRSFDKVNEFNLSKVDDYLADLKTWLSGAITYQETCLDGFENTTGDTGEKMKELLKSSGELTSNSLAMVSSFMQVLKTLQIPGISRRLLQDGSDSGDFQFQDTDGFPAFLDATSRRYLLAENATFKPNAVVAQDGSGQFKTITDAIKSIPKMNNATFVIFVKEGVYKEYVDIPRKVNKVMLIGEGPTKTKITGNKNYVDGIGTFKTATVAVNGDDFIAKDIGFENSAGAIKHQAVALRVSGDHATFFNCQMDGYQDTLYSHAYRQFYRNCTITGTIDFVFGDASAVFQNCKFIVRKPLENQACMVTAQGRKESRSVGAIVLQNCEIHAEKDFLDTKPLIKAYLGRPWKEFSRTIIMYTTIDGFIDPAGWSPWAGNFALDTLYFAEYQNKGPGADTSRRVKWKGIQKITPEIAESFTAGKYIQGDTWINAASIPYASGIMI